MKKIFTCIFAACLAVSSWAGEVYVRAGANSTSANMPFSMGTGTGYSISQQIYTKAELEAAGLKKGTITGVKFCYASLNGGGTVRNWKIYITKPMKSTTQKSDYQFAEFYSAGALAYSGNVTLPTSKTWFGAEELTTPYEWDGESNIMITINDITGTTISFTRYDSTYTTTGANNQGIYCYRNTSAYDVASMGGVTVTKSPSIPKVMFITSGGGAVAKLEASCSDNAFGTFDKAYEVKQATITVTGENLTEDVTVSAEAGSGLEVYPAVLDKDDVMAVGGATVTVTTTSSFVSGKKVTVSADSKSSSITFTGSAPSYSSWGSIQFLNNNTNVGDYANLTASSSKITSVDASNHSFVITSFSNSATIDYESVPGTYAVDGTISGLKVKKTDVDTYKALTFNYTAPVVSGITIAEGVDNSALLEQYDGQSVDVNFTRSFTAGMYNTICLPIKLQDGTLSATFGAGYSLIEFDNSSKDGDGAIVLSFNAVTTLEAGKPYFIKPTQNVVNPSFTNWLISKDLNPIETTYADFIPVFSPTALASSKDILFLGANNELFWPSDAGTLKGLRCYFQMKNGASAGAPVRMSIGRGTPTSNEALEDSAPAAIKRIENGQLIIERNGVRYNINGQIIK